MNKSSTWHGQWWMFKMITPMQTNQTAMVTGWEQSKLRQSEQCNITKARRYFRNKTGRYLKDKINVLVTHNKHIRDLYWGILNLWRVTRLELLCREERSNLLADSCNILNRRKNYSSQLWNVHGANDNQQIKVHTAEPLIYQPCTYEVHTAIKKWKGYKIQGTDTCRSDSSRRWNNVLRTITSLIQSSIRKKCLSSGRSLLLCLFTKGW